MALVAFFTASSLVLLAAAFVSILVHSRRSGRCSCPKLQIFERCISVDSVARSSALTVLEPVDTAVAGPLAHNPCHTSDVLRHVRQVLAVTGCLHKFSITLSHGNRVADEYSITLFKVKFHMEFIVGVDARGASGNVFACDVVLVNVQSAFTPAITVIIDSVGWGVTFVSSRVEGILIGLHEIELWAPVSSNLVCITILERILIVLHAGHQHSVKGGDTATADFTQVNIVFDGATEHVWHEVLRIVELLLSGQVHAIVVVISELSSICFCTGPRPVELDPEWSLNTIDVNKKLWVAEDGDCFSFIVLAAAVCIQ